MTGFFWGALCFFVAVSAWCGEISGRNVIAWAKDIKSKPLFRTVVSNRKTTLQFSADNTAPTRGVQFGVRSSRGLSAGDYRLTFTLESNTAFKQRFNVILHKAPWTVVEGKTVSVRAGVPEKALELLCPFLFSDLLDYAFSALLFLCSCQCDQL